MKFIGIDFGTSNSLASLIYNNQIRFVNFVDNRRSNPTVIYFPSNSKEFYIGTEAIQRYLTHLEEGHREGRFMMSIKTLLPDDKYDHTVVAGHGSLTAADLVAKFLSVLKRMAEKQFSQQFEGVVLSRPVEFTEIALKRLESAAKIAGFKEVILWMEPVAAALAYEATSTQDELICIVDLGGGTSDICVIETSPARSFRSNRQNDIKSVGGKYLAGDKMNSLIMERKLAPRFGSGSTFISLGKELPFPVHIINKLSMWHWVNFLRNPRDINTISTILVSSDRPEDVNRLLNLIKNYHSFELFQAIDRAKGLLSLNDRTKIEFKALDLHERFYRDEFEQIISPVTTEIEKSIHETLNFASVKPKDIDKVIFTGGTSQVPILGQLVENIFGKQKLLRPDVYSSVATGLGYIASRVNNG